MNIKEKPSHYSEATETQGREQPTLTLSGRQTKGYIPGEILVKFKDGTDSQAIAALQSEVQLRTIRVVSSPNPYLMKILDGSSVERMMECLRHYEEVKYSEPNYVRTVY